jgi:hypothetical protein
MNSKLVLNTIEELSGINIVNNKSRKYLVVEAKQLYSNIMRGYGHTYEYIGSTIGLDHATIIHHCKVYEYIKRSSPTLKDLEVNVLRRLDMSRSEVLRYKIKELRDELRLLEGRASHSTYEDKIN